MSKFILSNILGLNNSLFRRSPKILKNIQDTIKIMNLIILKNLVT